MFFFFFFQAEDGIRDLTVTGVQTCALPISRPGKAREIWKAVEHLPADLRRGGGGGDGGGGGGGRRHQPQALAEVGRVHIERTLRFHGGNRTRAAQAVGTSRRELINKPQAYGLAMSREG